MLKQARSKDASAKAESATSSSSPHKEQCVLQLPALLSRNPHGNDPVTFEVYQSCARRLGKRTHKAKMNPNRKLEREAHQLSESIQATCRILDSRTLPDASRKRLRNEVDLRTAARKSILKHLWVSPRTGVAERP
jgi:hypothetical protein